MNLDHPLKFHLLIVLIFLSQSSFSQKRYNCHWFKSDSSVGLKEKREYYGNPNGMTQAVSPSGRKFIREEDKIYLVDKDGRKLTKHAYQFVSTDPEFFPTITIDGKYGVFNTDFDFIIPPIYDNLHPFYFGGWLIQEENKWGLIDVNQDLIIKPQFDQIRLLSNEYFLGEKEEGIFLCGKKEGTIKFFGKVCYKIVGSENKMLAIRDKKKESLYCLNGKFICDITNVEKVYNFEDTIAIILKRGEEKSLISNDGDVIVPFGEYRFTLPHPNLKVEDFYVNAILKGNKAILYKNQDSLFAMDKPAFRVGYARRIYDLKAKRKISPLVVFKQDGMEGFVNLRSGYISKNRYAKVVQVGDNRYEVKLNGKSGLIDSLENVILPFEYSSMTSNYQSIIVEKDSLFAIFDIKGKMRMPFDYSKITRIGLDRSNERFTGIFIKDGKRGFYDVDFNHCIPPMYESVYYFSNGSAGVQLNGKWGYIDHENNLIIPFQFDKAQPFNIKGEAKVTLNDKKITIDTQGNCIKGCD